MRLDKSVQKTLIIMGGIVVLAILGYLAFSSLMPTNTVQGQGQATINAVPDLIGIYFNV